MNFCPASLLARWFGLAAFVTAAMTAAAQQQIQFTRPADPEISSKASHPPPPDTHQNPGSTFNAPSPLFSPESPTAPIDNLPGSPDAPTATAAQWQKFLDGKKNWMLLTPEEILGISTPEKILGVTDSKQDPQDPKLSAEERFMDRQDRQAAGATNNFHRPDASNRRDDSAKDKEATDSFQPANANSRFAETHGDAGPAAAKNFSTLFNLKSDSSLDVNQKPDSVWASPFGRQEPLPKPTPDQLAGMERFRALLDPSAPVKAPESSPFSFQPIATPGPNLLTAPAFNADVQPFTALDSDLGKPTGVAPLPDLTEPHWAPEKTTAPLVQLPPWLSDSPQSSTPLARPF